MTRKTPDLAPLPKPRTREGRLRRVGVEIEFGALQETRVAEIVQELFGGEVRRRSDKGLLVCDSTLGDIELYLDSQYLRDDGSKLEKSLHDLARSVVPVEIVTEPIEPAQIADLDRLVTRLRDEGATGTAAGVFLGFGVHFNPEVVAMDADEIVPVLHAFAFTENALREAMQIDFSRRVLPFVDPYPKALLDALATEEIGDLDDLMRVYLKNAPSRNHGLDMLCILAEHDADRVRNTLGDALVSARPTYHYRLPDCRIDEPGWSLALEWNRWVRVEEMAEDAELIADLRAGWRAHSAALTTRRADWVKRSAAMVGGLR
ncbi:amidoligase family protein [Litorisediminicola beolgyonensis]|uniref:Amidoligase family protein n=1 Tax=Litorisediminicola beolgyonensis TaxID=1173614 RepID=A0ABW3ZKN7_9RHOB